MDEILQAWGFDAGAMTWAQLAAAAEAPSVSWRTIQRALSNGGYDKCIACTKTYVPKPLMDKRKAWAQQKRNAYSIDDWKKVCFSDEVPFGRGPQRKLASQVNVNSKTVSKNRMSQRRRIKTRNVVTVGLWDITSSRS